MITTNDRALNDKLRKLRWMGISKDTYSRADNKYSWDYDVVEQGHKCHMSDIAATIGLVQLQKVDRMNKRRRELAEKYSTAFAQYNKEVILPAVKKGIVSAQHLYCLRLKRKDREDLINYLKERGVSAGVHYKPLYLHPRYKEYDRNNTPVADNTWKNMVTLPLYPDLTDSEIKEIISLVGSFLRSA